MHNNGRERRAMSRRIRELRIDLRRKQSTINVARHGASSPFRSRKRHEPTSIAHPRPWRTRTDVFTGPIIASPGSSETSSPSHSTLITVTATRIRALTSPHETTVIEPVALPRRTISPQSRVGPLGRNDSTSDSPANDTSSPCCTTRGSPSMTSPSGASSITTRYRSTPGRDENGPASTTGAMATRHDQSSPPSLATSKLVPRPFAHGIGVCSLNRWMRTQET